MPYNLIVSGVLQVKETRGNWSYLAKNGKHKPRVQEGIRMYDESSLVALPV